jgi:exonuclease V gamma subunit
MPLKCLNKRRTFHRLHHFISYNNNTQRKPVLWGFIKLYSILFDRSESILQLINQHPILQLINQHEGKLRATTVMSENFGDITWSE